MTNTSFLRLYQQAFPWLLSLSTDIHQYFTFSGTFTFAILYLSSQVYRRGAREGKRGAECWLLSLLFFLLSWVRVRRREDRNSSEQQASVSAWFDYIPGSVFLCFALEGAAGRLLEISKPAAPPPSILPLTDIPSDSGLTRSLQRSVVEKLPVRLIDNASCPALITEYTEPQSTTETGGLAVCFTIKPSI